MRLALSGLVAMEPQKAASILSMLVEAVVEANKLGKGLVRKVRRAS